MGFLDRRELETAIHLQYPDLTESLLEYIRDNLDEMEELMTKSSQEITAAMVVVSYEVISRYVFGAPTILPGLNSPSGSKVRFTSRNASYSVSPNIWRMRAICSCISRWKSRVRIDLPPTSATVWLAPPAPR